MTEPQHSEIGFPISTDIASWGNGPQTQKLAESQLTITYKLAGLQHSEIGFLISTDIANLWKRAEHSEIGFLISTDDAS
ncbi:TPA: hypothetical protein O5T82_002401 [Staphylococcus aureus]|nr:hypothetical protein [Staphylococcus aureus]